MQREQLALTTALSPPDPSGAAWRVRARHAVLKSRWPGRLAPWVLRAWPSSLAVLVYHRIDNPGRAGFFGDASNVSASPERFADHMDYVARHFDAVTLADVEATADGRARLPRRAVLVTFDDGYRDVLTEALPILRSRSIPAALFVATAFMGNARCFMWDSVVTMFQATRVRQARLPLLGDRQLGGRPDRGSAAVDWIAAAKSRPHGEMEATLDELANALDAPCPAAPPAGTHLTWDEVRLLRRRGVGIGAHTATHPIMSRIPLTRARTEIVGSRQRIEAELGCQVRSFAFPNGRTVDFRPEHEAMLREEAFVLGFSTRPGPTTLPEIRRRPFAVRRCCITAKDDVTRLALKITGVSRLKDF